MLLMHSLYELLGTFLVFAKYYLLLFCPFFRKRNGAYEVPRVFCTDNSIPIHLCCSIGCFQACPRTHQLHGFRQIHPFHFEASKGHFLCCFQNLQAALVLFSIYTYNILPLRPFWRGRWVATGDGIFLGGSNFHCGTLSFEAITPSLKCQIASVDFIQSFDST